MTTTTPEAPEQLRVSAASDPTKVAGAISAIVRKGAFPELTAIGASAVNAAVKAIGIARGHVAPMGHDLACVPSFFDVNIEGEGERTAIRFKLYAR